MLSTRSLLAVGVSQANVTKYLSSLNTSMTKFGITTSLDICNFLAQVLHESGGLLYTRELADGSEYEWRADLGNTHAGDGKAYRGRGLIQLTGRDVYKAYGIYANIPALDYPDLLEKLPDCVETACWFYTVYKTDWNGTVLSDLAIHNDFLRITYCVNGGFNGLTYRLRYLAKLMAMFVPDSKDKLQAIYKEIRKVLAYSPPPDSMYGVLKATVKTQENLDNIFIGVL